MTETHMVIRNSGGQYDPEVWCSLCSERVEWGEWYVKVTGNSGTTFKLCYSCCDDKRKAEVEEASRQLFNSQTVYESRKEAREQKQEQRQREYDNRDQLSMFEVEGV